MFEGLGELQPEPEDPQHKLRVCARSTFISIEVASVEAAHRMTNAGTLNCISCQPFFCLSPKTLANWWIGRAKLIER
ncbi:hypothetical protein [Sphingopyxis terrae]|uniref:hypothetical protein n=1 Tax=Sphingopyxis terrae TaxID=33052 RepID=UPI003F7FCC29